MLKSLPPQFISSTPIYRTMRGGSLTDPSPSLVAGRSGRALYFAGNGSYTVADNTSEINFGTGDLSISLWIKTTGSYGTLVEKRSSSTQAGYHVIVYNRKLLFQLGNATKYLNFWNPNSVSVADGSWHHVAVTVDRDNTSGGKLYVDGSVIHTFNPTDLQGSTDNTAPLYLARHRDGNWPYIGYIDDLYMSHRVLTQAELAGIYTTGSLQVVLLPLGTWLWNADLIKGDTSSIFAFLVNKGVSEVYLHIDPSIAPSFYGSFIQTARGKVISVQALVGDPAWVAAGASTNDFDNRMTYVRNYNAAYPQATFSAVHLDVEPYLVTGWDSRNPTGSGTMAVISRYQDFVRHASGVVHSMGLPLMSDIPFWYDTVFLASDGSPLLEWLVKNNDGICVMDYRDTIPLTIHGAVDEYHYADMYGKRLMVAVETINGSSFITNAYDQLFANYSSYENWGFAVHHLASWMTLNP